MFGIHLACLRVMHTRNNLEIQDIYELNIKNS